MKKIGAITTAILVYSAIVFYLGWCVFIWLDAFLSVNRWIFFSGWTVMAYALLIARIDHRFRLFHIIGSYWMIIMQYGIILFPMATIATWIMPDQLIIIGSIVFFLFVMSIIIGTYNAYTPVVRELSITLPKKDAKLNSLKVVVASDFHLGLLSNKAHLQRFVKKSNEERPDVVLLVGDLVDDDPIWFVKKGMSEVMKQLTSTYGNYGVLGNHEYYGKKIPLLVEEMEASNVKMLLDETIVVADSFYLTGREDLTNKERKQLADLAPKVHNLPWFVMDHTPSNLVIPEKEGTDFHVSGHTHRGQMWPNHLFTRKLFELDYGYKQKGSLHAVVSSGFGFWGPPIRLGSQSELWSVNIKLEDVGV
ncbi:metallophosphoesterase [Psychrobacillus lasiicapitis]|uniref:Metallophosphoesterase n=1 Tax=Psychrobacillus lasiicapitis TaxID=1636719 RepID=A0A544T6Q8_9BACI|nr:metallophosphoesterase [Psychrobacillus lasiicapitis]TQR13127.1 metallophosphoesterase [Psychrobacillus lasiicapitis]